MTQDSIHVVGKNQLVLPIGDGKHLEFYFKHHVKPMNGVKPEVYCISGVNPTMLKATKRSYQDEDL